MEALFFGRVVVLFLLSARAAHAAKPGLRDDSEETFQRVVAAAQGGRRVRLRDACEEACATLDCAATPETCELVRTETGCDCKARHGQKHELASSSSSSRTTRRRLSDDDVMNNGTDGNMTEPEDPGYDVCEIQDSDPSSCPLSAIGRVRGTVIVPGEPTSCAFGAPFSFQVWRGDPDKLLVLFRGGAPLAYDAAAALAFLDQDSETTSVNVEPIGLVAGGVYSRLDARNPFQNYTLISIPNCAGDVHLGNVTASYVGGLLTVEHKGAVNAEAAFRWLDEALHSVKPVPYLGIVGVSAGSIAPGFYAPRLLERFGDVKLTTTTVVGDASPALPMGPCPGVLLYAHTVRAVNGCGLLPSRALIDICESDELSSTVGWDGFDILKTAIPLLGPRALWVEMGGKNDIVLRILLSDVSVASLEVEAPSPLCDAYSFTDETAELFYGMQSKYYARASNEIPNYIAYLINFTTHNAVDFRSSIVTLAADNPIDTFNPFANASAPSLAAEDGAFVPSAFFDVDTQGYFEDDMKLEPILVDWLTTVVEDRVGCGQCAGVSTDVDFDSEETGLDLDVCDAAILDKCYDGFIPCDTDDDCPVASICDKTSSSRKRALRFGSIDAGVCRPDTTIM